MIRKQGLRLFCATAIALAATLLWFGCPECGCAGGEGIRCGPPVIFAGEDIQAEAGHPVVLKAEVRLPPEEERVCVTEKEAVTYEWEQVSGPSVVELHGADYMDVSFIPDRSGTYEFSLRAIYTETQINDEQQASDWDFIQVNVAPTVCGNPIANPGPDQTITTAASTPADVVLDGGRSHPDPGFGCRDLAIAGYRWWVAEQPPGSDITIVNRDLSRATATLTVPGDYRFELVVHDSEGRTGTESLRATLVDQRPCDETLDVAVVSARDNQPISGAHVTVVDAVATSHVSDTNAQGLAFFDALAPGKRQQITVVSDETVPALPGTNDDDRPRFETTTVLDHCSDHITIPLHLTASGQAAIPRGAIIAKVPQNLFDMLPHSNKRAGNCDVDEDCVIEYHCEETHLAGGQCTPDSLLPFYSLGDNNISGQFRAVALMPVLPVDNLSSFPLDRLFAKPPGEGEIMPGSLATDDSFLNGLAPSLGRDPWGDPCNNTEDCPDTLNYICEQDYQGDYRCKDKNPLRNIAMDVPAGENVSMALVGGIMDISSYFGLAYNIPWLFNDGDVNDFPVLLKGTKFSTLFICMVSVKIEEGGQTDITRTLGSLTSDQCWHVDYITKEAIVGLEDPILMDLQECTTDADCCDNNGRCGWPDSGNKCLTHSNSPGYRYCQWPLFRVQIISENNVVPRMAGTGLDPRTEDADGRLRSWLPDRSSYEVFCDEQHGCSFLISRKYPPYHCDPPQIESARVPGDAECMFPYGLSVAALDFPEGHATLPEGGRVIVGFDFSQTPILNEGAPGVLIPSLDLPELQGASMTVAHLTARNVVTMPDGNFGTPPGKLGTVAVTDLVASSIDLYPFMAPETLDPQLDVGFDVEVIFMPEDSTVWPNPVMKRVYAEATRLKSPLTALPPHVLPTSITLSNLTDGTLRSVVLSRVDREGNYYGFQDPQWRIYAPAGTTTIPLTGDANPFSIGEEVWVSLEKAGFDVPFDYNLFPIDLILRRQVMYSEDSYALIVP